MDLRSLSPILLTAAAWSATGQGLIRPEGGSIRADQTPAALEGVRVEEKPGAQIDLSLQFVGEDGSPKPLSVYFQKGRPVLLDLVYYTCPMLCNLVLNGQVKALREVPMTPGKEFEVVTISIDPTENFGIAQAKKSAYLTTYEKPAPGWHFLADYQGNAKKLAEQVGFHYRLDERSGQYAHAAAIMFLTPDGKVSRYLYGVQFKPLDVRLALAEAAEGKSGFSLEQLLLYCFHYNPAEKAYVLFARNIMRAGGVLTVLTLGAVLYFLWRRERFSAAQAKGLVTAK
jgi:protein SCO1/2